jgi:O-antigen ligase
MATSCNLHFRMTAIVFIAALVGLVWGGLFFLRGSLVVGCLGVLLAVCCFGYEFVHFEPSLTIDRIVLAATLAAYIVQRALGRTDPKPFNTTDAVTVGFVGLLLVSMLASDWHGLPKNQISPLWRWVGGYFSPLLLYWIAKQAPWNERTARLVQGGLLVFGVYLGFTAVCEITKTWALVFPKYIADPTVGLHFGRARGPMVHGVSFGHYQGVCLLAAWLCFLRAKQPWKLLVVAIVPLFLAGVFFCYTRSVWMGTALGLVLVLWMTLAGRTRQVVLGGIALSGLLVGLTQMDRVVGFQREQSAADTRESADMRVSFAYVSWQMFLDRPLTGFGFGRFPVDKLPYLADRTTEQKLEKLRPYVHHNTYLSLLTDTGLVGLGLFLAMLGRWLVDARRVYVSDAPVWCKHQAALLVGAMGVYACQLMFHELSYTPIDNSLIFFLAGCSGALVPQTSPSPAVWQPAAWRRFFLPATNM